MTATDRKMAFKLQEEMLRVQAEHEKLERLNRQLEATIEERKRAGELAAQHADFRERVFNSLDAALAVVMPDGMISEVNEAWRRFALANNGADESMWGKGANYFREARPECGDTTSVLEAYEGLRLVQRGELEFFTLEYPCHSPLKKRWFIMRAMPLKGWPGTVLVSHTDITAAWENRVALEGSQRLLALSQEIAHVGSWELDVAAGNLTWSDETFRIFGAAPQEFTPTYNAFLEFVHPEDQAAVDEAYTGSLREGQSGYEIEHRIIHKGSGEVRFVREKCIHYRDPAGTVVRSTGMIEDISERVQARESLEHAVDALRASETLFRNVFEHHTAVKLLLDPATGKILDANEAAVEFYGWTKEQLLRMRISDINTLSPEEVEAALATAHGLRRTYFEFRHRLADGSVRDVAAFASIIGTGDRNVLHSIIIDITDRKQAEKEREEALEAVQRQLQEKDLLLRETHHRIKNNIASIQTLLLMQARETTDPGALSALQDAAGRVSGMRVLYDRMLMADRYQEVGVSTYLGGLVDSVVGLLAGETHVVVEKRFDNITLSSRVLFPLGLIVNEIVTNMIKHAFAGRECGTVRVGAMQEGKRVTVNLGDDGNGLPPGFDVGAAKGFGLTLVRMLCQQIDGELTADSGGAGTRWTLVFDAE